MIKHLLLATGFVLSSFSFFAQQPHRTINSIDVLKNRISENTEVCKADQNHQRLMETDPVYADNYRANLIKVNEIINNPQRQQVGTLTIPVVVHVLHLGEAIGTGTNISDAQIISAINNLNDCYSGAGSYINDIGVQFQLAQRDPNCNVTSGIVRTDASGVADYAANGITTANETTIKAISKWDNNEYYNIWIVSEIDNNDQNSYYGTQGYAYYPGAGPSVDGAVILFNSFGYDPTETLGYNLKTFTKYNVTTSHEIGHALNLKHTFEGDNNGTQCPVNTSPTTQGDFCSDTPAHNRNDGDCGSTGLTCDGGDLADIVTNIMSYSSDQCQVKFSLEQKSRMRAALQGTRASLLTSRALTAPNGFVAPVAATCTPTTTTQGNSSGILNTELNGRSISSGSSSSDGGYVDYSAQCSNYFEIDATLANTINVDVYTVNFQQLIVGIDWNDDGDFNDDNELQLTSQDIAASSTVPVTILYPTVIPYNDYVRCRIITDLDDRYGNTLLSSLCDNPGNGQGEDYSIYVMPSATVAPTADFNADITSGCVGQTITFTDASTDSPTSWSWNFGDGNTSTSQNPTHAYASNGTYTVTLTATNASGSDVATKTNYISVSVNPDLSVMSSTAETCASNDGTATISPSGGSGSYTYVWDANAGSQTTATATGLSANTYNVVVTDAVSTCSSNTNVVVSVNCPTPIAAFSADQTSLCNNTTITFTDASTNSPTSWYWDFGDGNTSTLQNPTHSYVTAGTYDVTLTATNAGGSDQEAKLGYVIISDCQTTKLQTTYCGITVSSVSDYLYADYVTGGQSYMFRFTNTSTAAVYSYERYNNVATLAWAGATEIGATYDVQVKVKVNGVWGNYSTVCQVSTPASYPTTQLKTAYCGISVASLSDYIYADYVNGAQSYMFKFTNTSTAAAYTYTRYNNVATLAWAGATEPGATYDVQVRIKMGGSWGNYGPVCQVSTPAASQTTQLQSAYCGSTASSFTQNIFADYVPGAQSYMFRFTNTSTAQQYFYQRFNNVSTLIWAGISDINTTYDVQVMVKVGGAWGNYGPVCQVTSPATAILLSENSYDLYNQTESINPSLENKPSFNAFPNPNEGQNIYIDVAGLEESSNEVEIKLIDMYGKVLYTDTQSSDASHILKQIYFNEKLVSGIYLMSIQKGNSSVVKKIFVK